ncbi:MAG TPA: hypothetical protein VLA64_12400, partial [Azonexus sp.]|nr:hypothetical protein [Azonexus sp.]
AAIAYVVVPMFQLTPGYPARSSWWYPVVILALLLSWSGAVLLDSPALVRFSQALAALAGLAFAGLTLRLQGKRRRARPDVTYRYWQLGLVGSVLALFMLLTAAIWPATGELQGWTMIFGILLIAGGFLPFIIGMLYKIVPFLTWMHLQNLGQAKVPAPNMSKILPTINMDRQMKAYTVAVVLLLAAVLQPQWLSRPAGLAFAVASAWLWLNLFGAIRRYVEYKTDIESKLAEILAAR